MTLLLTSFGYSAAQQHLSYNSAIDLATCNGKIFCTTSFSLFSVSTGNKTIERVSRITGLNETGINAIYYNNANENGHCDDNRAAGGLATCDGKDYKRTRISTGFYLVLVNNDERTENTAAKIVFINK